MLTLIFITLGLLFLKIIHFLDVVCIARASMSVTRHILAFLFDAAVEIVFEVDFDFPSIDSMVIGLLLTHNAEEASIRKEEYLDAFVFLSHSAGLSDFLEIVFLEWKDNDGSMVAVQYDFVISQHSKSEEVGSDFSLVEEFTFWGKMENEMVLLSVWNQRYYGVLVSKRDFQHGAALDREELVMFVVDARILGFSGSRYHC